MRDTPNPDLAHQTDSIQSTATARRWIWWVIGAIVIGLAAWWWFRPSGPAPVAEGDTAAPPKRGARFDPTKSVVPVAVAAARAVDMPVRIGALGTVTARNTALVKARVDGLLEKVNFREGQLVRAGDVLAQIDPKPFEVQLEQAQGQLERDRAQLQNAQNDLVRYRNLLAQDSIAAQQVDNQEALVRQYQATVVSDQAAVEGARLNLVWTRITAPTNGRTGLRQVDAGNMIHAADTNGLVVITEVDPIAVIFPVPQDLLPQVMGQLQRGAQLSVDAYDREGRTKLATGVLVTADNVIDTTTGTVKLKAEFPNKDGALFPNQFVNARLLVQTLKGAIAIPTSAIQRGAPGTFVYVIKDDNSVTVRPIKAGAVDGELTAVTDGLAAGEKVVADGADKLREGAKVEPIDSSAKPSRRAGGTTGAAGTGNGEHKKGNRKRDNATPGAAPPADAGKDADK
ncbi:MAG TPA: MdtA/MuxA family multidrug efflux RND transporter periplasmic adaptor subunit [Burkholderiaceae bacterium]|nr:MdtA/MuxA family multidrug efflux RND transporter periplasmic adaptor subunit [Burkholderiaceae bacterium]